MLDAGFLHAEDSDRHVSLAIGAVAGLLFDRSSRAIKLTPAGKAFLAEARRLLQQSERAALSVHKIANGQTRSVPGRVHRRQRALRTRCSRHHSTNGHPRR